MGSGKILERIIEQGKKNRYGTGILLGTRKENWNEENSDVELELY